MNSTLTIIVEKPMLSTTLIYKYFPKQNIMLDVHRIILCDEQKKGNDDSITLT